MFYETVHTINAKDYTDEQLNVWATGSVDLAAWDASLQSHLTYVMTEGNLITGFGDMDEAEFRKPPVTTNKGPEKGRKQGKKFPS